MRFIAATLGLLVLPALASAHHSRVHFSGEVQEFVGEITDLQWRNPHIVFTLKTMNSSGQAELINVETNSFYYLRRMGVTREHFETGGLVRVAARESSRRAGRFITDNVMLPDGRELILDTDVKPRWGGEYIGGDDRWITKELQLTETEIQNRGLFRVWSLPTWQERTQHLPFTEAAIAGRSAWSPAENFVIRCEQPGMPRPMFNPHPFEFIDKGGYYTLLGEEFDIVRTIHMSDAEDPQDQPPTRLGYSLGRWEDNTLVIVTTRISWPYFDGIGTPQSEAVELLERFTLSEDQSRLDYHLTIEDPATFTGPATLKTHWLALGEAIEPYECHVY